VNVAFYRIFRIGRPIHWLAAAGKSVPAPGRPMPRCPAASSAPRPAGTVMIAKHL
jgi:hypothetical protein